MKKSIYNMHQANFFIENNGKVIEVGIDNKRNAYVIFNYDDNLENLYKLWNSKGRSEDGNCEEGRRDKDKEK